MLAALYRRHLGIMRAVAARVMAGGCAWPFFGRHKMRRDGGWAV